MWKAVGIGIAVLFGFAVLGVVGTYIGVIGNVASAPGRVINKTLETDNIIQNYNWFFDTNAQYESRLGQIASYRKILDGTTDQTEKNRLTMEAAAMSQTCRELANQYSANSMKLTSKFFKDHQLPESLDPAACDL